MQQREGTETVVVGLFHHHREDGDGAAGGYAARSRRALEQAAAMWAEEPEVDGKAVSPEAVVFAACDVTDVALELAEELLTDLSLPAIVAVKAFDKISSAAAPTELTDPAGDYLGSILPPLPRPPTTPEDSG